MLCREAYVTPASGGLHSLGASYDEDKDPELRAESQRGKPGQDALDAGRPVDRRRRAAERAGRIPLRWRRTACRWSAPGRCGAALGAERQRELHRQAGLFGLLGYASRGLTWAPLAAELLAAGLDGEPLPLEPSLVPALDPGRFHAARTASQASASRGIRPTEKF